VEVRPAGVMRAGGGGGGACIGGKGRARMNLLCKTARTRYILSAFRCAARTTSHDFT
jgi:hypothetical protein